MERISQSNDSISFIKEKILEIDSYTTEYNSRDFDDDLRDYHLSLVESLLKNIAARNLQLRYLKAIVEYLIEYSPLKTIAEKMKSILRGTLILFREGCPRKLRIIQDNHHYLSQEVILIQKEYYEIDSEEWYLNDLRIRFDVIKYS